MDYNVFCAYSILFLVLVISSDTEGILSNIIVCLKPWGTGDKLYFLIDSKSNTEQLQ